MIQTSQYNIDKQNCEKKVDNFERKIHDVSGLVTTAVCNAKMGVVESKIPSVIDLLKKPVYDAKTSDFQEKISLLLIIIDLRMTYLQQR